MLFKKFVLTCHCIRRSLVSNASTTMTSWHIMAIVFDSLSKVKPVSTPRKCSKEREALVCPFLYLSLESRYNCKWRQSESKNVKNIYESLFVKTVSDKSIINHFVENFCHSFIQHSYIHYLTHIWKY